MKFITYLLAVSAAKKIECPKLVCFIKGPIHLENNECFRHDGNVPTKEIYSDSCEYHKSMSEEFEGKVLFDFDLASKEYAWVNETT